MPRIDYVGPIFPTGIAHVSGCFLLLFHFDCPLHRTNGEIKSLKHIILVEPSICSLAYRGVAFMTFRSNWVLLLEYFSRGSMNSCLE